MTSATIGIWICIGYVAGLLSVIIYFFWDASKPISKRPTPLFVLHSRYYFESESYDEDINIMARNYALAENEWISSVSWIMVYRTKEEENNMIHLWRPKDSTFLETKKKALDAYYKINY